MNNKTSDNKNGIIIYNKDYNLSLYGIEKLHPFDSFKYKKIYNQLINEEIVQLEKIISPVITDEKLLQQVHTPEYLRSLSNPLHVARIVEILPIALFPSAVIRRRIVYPQKLAAFGTLIAGETALEQGLAINLAGGYHHAHSESGSGFCIYAALLKNSVWRN